MSNISTYLGSGGGASGGGGQQLTDASCINLTSDNSRSISVCFSSAGSVYLPDATTLEPGSPIYTIKNIGSSTALLYDYCGNLYNYLNSQESISASLYNNTCVQGGWTIEKATTNLSSVIIESPMANPEGVTVPDMDVCYFKCCQEQGRAYFVGYKGNCVYTARGQYCSSTCSFQLSTLHQCCLGAGFTNAASTRYPGCALYHHTGMLEVHPQGIFINIACDGTACVCCMTDLCYCCLGNSSRYLQTTDGYSRVGYVLPVCGQDCAQMAFMYFGCNDGISCQYCKVDVPIINSLGAINDGACNAGSYVYLGSNTCVANIPSAGGGTPCLIWAVDFYTGYNNDLTYPDTCTNINRVNEIGNHWFFVQAPCIKAAGTCDFHYIESNNITTWPCCSSGWTDYGGKMCMPTDPCCRCDACSSNYLYDFLCSLSAGHKPTWQFKDSRKFAMAKYICLSVFCGGGGSANCARCSIYNCGRRASGNSMMVCIPSACPQGCQTTWATSNMGNCSCRWCGINCWGCDWISNPVYRMARVGENVAVWQNTAFSMGYHHCYCIFNDYSHHCLCTYCLNWDSQNFNSKCALKDVLTSDCVMCAVCQNIGQLGNSGNRNCITGDAFDSRIYNDNAKAQKYYGGYSDARQGHRISIKGGGATGATCLSFPICTTSASNCYYEFVKIWICNTNGASNVQRWCLPTTGFNLCETGAINVGRFDEYACNCFTFAGNCGRIVHMIKSGTSATACIHCIDYSASGWNGSPCCFSCSLTNNEDLYETQDYLVKLCINPANNAVLPCSTRFYDVGSCPCHDFRQDSDQVYMRFTGQTACLCQFIYPTIQFGYFDSDQGGIVKGSKFQSNDAPVNPAIILHCGAGVGSVMVKDTDGTLKTVQFASACR